MAYIKDIRTITDQRGSLSFLEGINDIPFAIKRIYYLYNCNSRSRGGHAHKALEQAFIALHGSCSISIDDGYSKVTHILSDPTKALVIPSGLWRDIYDFNEECVLLVLASEYYDERDYLRSYDEFLEYVQNK